MVFSQKSRGKKRGEDCLAWMKIEEERTKGFCVVISGSENLGDQKNNTGKSSVFSEALNRR